MDRRLLNLYFESVPICREEEIVLLSYLFFQPIGSSHIQFNINIPNYPSFKLSITVSPQ